MRTLERLGFRVGGLGFRAACWQLVVSVCLYNVAIQKLPQQQPCPFDLPQAAPGQDCTSYVA